MFSRAKSIFYCYISFFLFAIYVLFVRSILFPNNKLHQGLLQKRKIDPIELYAWLLSNRLFQYKIQRALTHFSISRWLLKHQMIFWMKKKMSFASIICSIRTYSTEIDTLSEKWNDCYRLCRHGYFCIFWGRKGVGWFLNQQYPFLHFLITHNSCVVFEFLWWASTFQKCTFFGF